MDLRPRFADPALEEVVRRLCRRVRERGGRAFLVGGPVRDVVLATLGPEDAPEPSEEADLEVYGLSPEVLEATLAELGQVRVVGRSFAVLHLTTEHGTLEVSLPRRESKTGPGHKGFAVAADPEMDPREACRRRDFTVNAMLLDPLDGTLLDPWGGRRDLAAGLLRHVSPAFAEDPLRVLRAGRFAARHGWRVHAETAALCRRLDLGELPVERFEGEWRQILLRGRRPGHGLRVLEEVGALRFFPELQALRQVPHDPVWHPEGDVFVHTCLCLDAAVAIRPEMADPWVEMLAVLCHDLGKATCTRFERGRWRSPEHDIAGQAPTLSLVARLTRKAETGPAVAALVREHLRPTQLFHARDPVSDGAIRRLADRVDLAALVRVAWADAAGREEALPFAAWEPGRWLLERAAGLGVRDGAPPPLLQGRDLLALGMAPGPAVGRLLAEARELQLDGWLPDREAALAWARERLGASTSAGGEPPGQDPAGGSGRP